MLLIPSLKHTTKKLGINSLPTASVLYLSLQAYRGDMEPLVDVGSYVRKFEPLAKATGTFASTLPAPVSGTILEIATTAEGTFMVLENDYQEVALTTTPPTLSNFSVKELRQLLTNFGIEGAGGSRFPTQLKYNINEGSIHTLLFNGVECEPYLSADVVLMMEKTKELLQAAQLLQRYVKANDLIFVIERQQKALFKKLTDTAALLNLSIQICQVPDTYPQGGELQVIRSATGKILKKGELPLSHGILLNNVGTLYAIYKALFQGIPFVERQHFPVSIKYRSCFCS